MANANWETPTAISIATIRADVACTVVYQFLRSTGRNSNQ